MSKMGAIEVGRDVFLGHGVTIVARERIDIGDGAEIAEYVSIRDQDHDHNFDGPTRMGGFMVAPIAIGPDVWVGAKASILRGSTVGRHAVIGAHALVEGDIPPNAIAVGVPAKVIRYRKMGGAIG